jgi:DNA-directed RNA polymerase specialized sigma subunit
METDFTTRNARLQNARVRVQPYLDRLKRREMTNREVANELNLAEEHVCRVLAELNFEKDPPVDRAAMKRATAAKKARIAQFAAAHPPEEAARLAGVSLRTIYRYLEKQKK